MKPERLTIVLLIGLAVAVRSEEGAEKVTGRVTEAETNVAIQDAHVSLTINAKGDFSTKTDREGYYTFEHLPAGVGSISITKAGFGSLTPFSDPDHAYVDLRDHRPETRNFSISRSSTLLIRIVDTDTGVPVTGITVKPMRSDFGVGVKRYLPVHDAASSEPAPGVASISGLVAGDYIIEFKDAQDRDNGYGRSYYPSAPAIEAASVLTIAPGVTQHLDAAVRKRRLLQVSGFVKIIEGEESEIQVSLTKEGPGIIEVIGRAELPKSGPFQIAGISEGHYRLMASARAPSPADVTYDEAEIDVADKDLTQVHLNLQKGSRVRGKIFYPDNFPVDHPPSITFSDVYRLKVGPSLHTDFQQDGSFQFENAVRGTYSYILSGVPEGLIINKVTYRDMDVTDSTFTIDASSSLAEFRIYTTQTFCLVSGDVESSDDTPLPNVTVLVMPDPIPDSFDPLKLKSVKTDADGRFTLRLPLGDYRAVAISSADAQSLRDVQMIQRNFTAGVRFTASSIAAHIKLEQ